MFKADDRERGRPNCVSLLPGEGRSLSVTPCSALRLTERDILLSDNDSTKVWLHFPVCNTNNRSTGLLHMWNYYATVSLSLWWVCQNASVRNINVETTYGSD